MQRIRRPPQSESQVNRHGDAKQRQERSYNHALLGEGAMHELTAVQFASQVHETPCGKQIHGYADRDKRRSKPE